MRPPKNHPLTILKGFSTGSADSETEEILDGTTTFEMQGADKAGLLLPPPFTPKVTYAA
jgi:hypothetical protein